MPKVVLLRHGESTWNRENRFTGWHDVDLTDRGRDEARESRTPAERRRVHLRRAFTSVLRRAIKTLGSRSTRSTSCGFPSPKSWKLNERHYGALQGLNKAETAAQHGEAQTKVWRRSFDIPPPALTIDDERHPSREPALQGAEADRSAVDRVAEGHDRPLCRTGMRRSRRRLNPAAE